jgi:hypothetical protein
VLLAIVTPHVAFETMVSVTDDVGAVAVPFRTTQAGGATVPNESVPPVVTVRDRLVGTVADKAVVPVVADWAIDGSKNNDARISAAAMYRRAFIFFPPCVSEWVTISQCPPFHLRHRAAGIHGLSRRVPHRELTAE